MKSPSTLITLIRDAWGFLRTVSGDNAYERYLEHHRLHHQQDGSTPLSRRAFHATEVQRRWSGIKRCC